MLFIVKEKPMNEYIIYTRPDCSYCDRAKKLILDKGHKYTEVVLGKDVSKEEFQEMFPGQTTVPVLVLNGNKIGGFTELNESVKQQILKG